MFKLNANKTFKRKVTVFTPSEEVNKYTEGNFTATFLILSQGEIQDLEDNDDTLLSKVLKGVEDIGDENGNPLPNNEDTLTLIRNDACCSAACIREYIRGMKGKNLRQKN